MYLLYSFALAVLFVLLFPYFLYQALRHGKYISSFKERLGFLPVSLKDNTRPTIWVHTVSVGEFLAARPLLEKLKKEMHDVRLVVSTTTLTGQKLARAEEGDKIDAVIYFPFDWKFSVRRALQIIQPSAVIILETEIWANFLRECQRRSIVTMIVNGRISPRSFNRYRRIQKFMSGVLNQVTMLIMQSAADAERILALGASAERVRVCGNIKYDMEGKSQKSKVKSQELDEHFALSATKNLIVAGSTAAGEEKLLLAAFKELRGRQPVADARLLLAPRHPERFNEVAEILQASGFRYVRRSQVQAPSEETQQADVILLDTIGELALTYRFAAVVFVGGSLVAKGGHNILEAALYGKPILTGLHTDNFRQIISDFTQANALVQVSADNLVAEFGRLLEDRQAARAMGERGLQVLEQNRGAVDCIFAEIQKELRIKN